MELNRKERGLNVRIDCELIIGSFHKEKYTNYKITDIIPIINQFLETKLNIKDVSISRNHIWNMIKQGRCCNKLLCNFIKITKHINI